MLPLRIESFRSTSIIPIRKHASVSYYAIWCRGIVWFDQGGYGVTVTAHTEVHGAGHQVMMGGA
jgi:hypothetical protein